MWTDHAGVEYRSEEEWEYVNGPASPADCTPGRRDTANEDKTPQQFMDEVSLSLSLSHTHTHSLSLSLARTRALSVYLFS